MEIKETIDKIRCRLFHIRFRHPVRATSEGKEFRCHKCKRRWTEKEQEPGGQRVVMGSASGKTR